MKIQIQDETVDTDKLNDKDAAIHEALENFYQVCKQYDVSAIVRLALNDKTFLSLQTVPKSEEKKNKDYTFLIGVLAAWLERVTQGRLKVVDTEENS